tara:strand:+ start:143 stop:334 length:192 start_codon:yes stop_codon:yes gene_type:complete
LFIGLLVNTIQTAVEKDTETEFEKLHALVRSETDQVDVNVGGMHAELRELRAEISELRGTPNE